MPHGGFDNPHMMMMMMMIIYPVLRHGHSITSKGFGSMNELEFCIPVLWWHRICVHMINNKSYLIKYVYNPQIIS